MRVYHFSQLLDITWYQLRNKLMPFFILTCRRNSRKQTPITKAWAKRRTFHETNQTLIWVDQIKLRSSVGSDVELKTRRTNQQNQISNKIPPNEAKYTLSYKLLIISPVRRMWRSTIVGDDLQTFYPSEADDENTLDDPSSYRWTLLSQTSKFSRP